MYRLNKYFCENSVCLLLPAVHVEFVYKTRKHPEHNNRWLIIFQRESANPSWSRECLDLLIILFIYSSIHPCIYSYIYLFIYSSTYTPIHIFIYSPIHLFIYSSIHLFTYSPIHLFIYSSIYLFIIHVFIYSLIHLNLSLSEPIILFTNRSIIDLLFYLSISCYKAANY